MQNEIDISLQKITSFFKCQSFKFFKLGISSTSLMIIKSLLFVFFALSVNLSYSVLFFNKYFSFSFNCFPKLSGSAHCIWVVYCHLGTLFMKIRRKLKLTRFLVFILIHFAPPGHRLLKCLDVDGLA